jgi:hypothetical protein
MCFPTASLLQNTVAIYDEYQTAIPMDQIGQRINKWRQEYYVLFSDPDGGGRDGSARKGGRCPETQLLPPRGQGRGGSIVVAVSGGGGGGGAVKEAWMSSSDLVPPPPPFRGVGGRSPTSLVVAVVMRTLYPGSKHLGTVLIYSNHPFDCGFFSFVRQKSSISIGSVHD